MLTWKPPASPLLARLNSACREQHRSRRDISFDPALKRIARLEAIVPLFLEMARKELSESMSRQKAEKERQISRMAEEAKLEKVKRAGIDHGPSIQRRRGDLVLEERVDIGSTAETKPSILAARRADPLRVILKIKSVHRPHDGANADDARRWIAAQTYRNLVEIAGGARISEKPMERVDRSRGSSGPNDMILDCLGIVAGCKTAMGAANPVVRWVVEEYSDLDELAAVSRRTVAEAEEALLAGLDALAEQLASYHGPATA